MCPTGRVSGAYRLTVCVCHAYRSKFQATSQHGHRTCFSELAQVLGTHVLIAFKRKAKRRRSTMGTCARSAPWSLLPSPRSPSFLIFVSHSCSSLTEQAASPFDLHHTTIQPLPQHPSGHPLVLPERSPDLERYSPDTHVQLVHPLDPVPSR